MTVYSEPINETFQSISEVKIASESVYFKQGFKKASKKLGEIKILKFNIF
jgi:hypothetical protein